MIADFLAVQRIAAAAAILSVAHCTLQAGTNVEHSLQRRGDGQGEVRKASFLGRDGKWDEGRACAMNKLRNFSTIAITGSGLGVKSALVAGMGSVAVINPHVAYQDFGGADEVVRELNAAAAKAVLEVLRV